MAETESASRHISILRHHLMLVQTAVLNANASFEGVLERADAERISGWVCDTVCPSRMLSVEIYDGEHHLMTAACLPSQSDGQQNIRHRFDVQASRILTAGADHLIDVLIEGTEYRLENAPIKFHTAR